MKASARHILTDAAKEPGWVPAHARSDAELWTAATVKKALVDAFRMLKRVGGRVGPAGMKAAWPEYGIEQADFVQQSINRTLRATKVQPSYETAMTVTRMEQILCGWRDQDGVEHPAWMQGNLIAVPELREKLLAWVKSEVRGEPFVDLCRRKHWALSTAKRHRDRAAYLVADRLNRAGVPAW